MIIYISKLLTVHICTVQNYLAPAGVMTTRMLNVVTRSDCDKYVDKIPPHPSFYVECCSTSMPLFVVEVITYPCHYSDSGSDNLVSEIRLQMWLAYIGLRQGILTEVCGEIKLQTIIHRGCGFREPTTVQQPEKHQSPQSFTVRTRQYVGCCL